MDIHNFQLGSVFQQNARELCTRPVRAAKYQLGWRMGGWFISQMLLLREEAC